MNLRLGLLAALTALPSLLGACAAVGTQQAGAPEHLRTRPAFDGQVTLGGGRIRHDIEGGPDDRTSAGYVGMRVEGYGRAGYGAGLSIESTGSDDDLFEGQALGSQEVSTVEIAPYFLYRVAAGDRFRMPVRVGPWIHALERDDQSNSDSLTWVSVGLKAGVEPEVLLAQHDDFAFSVFSAVSLAGGATSIEVDTATVDDDFESDGGAFGFEIGPRVRWSHFMAAISFLHRSAVFDDSDPENGVTIPGIHNRVNALAFTFGGSI